MIQLSDCDTNKLKDVFILQNLKYTLKVTSKHFCSQNVDNLINRSSYSNFFFFYSHTHTKKKSIKKVLKCSISLLPSIKMNKGLCSLTSKPLLNTALNRQPSFPLYWKWGRVNSRECLRWTLQAVYKTRN